MTAGGMHLGTGTGTGTGPGGGHLASAHAVRLRSADLTDWLEVGEVGHFRWNPDALPRAAEYVAEEILRNYPDLDVPYHSRWRHFEWQGEDLSAPVLGDAGALENARRRIDLVVPSVLLDAGAGPDWAFHDAVTGVRIGRSEGLALASLRLFGAGQLSSRPDAPLRTDSRALQTLAADTLEQHLQSSIDNPLVGIEARLAVLRRLGTVLAARPDVFGDEGRLGNLVDHLLERASGSGTIEADAVLRTVLELFGAIWPTRLQWQGLALADCWRHPASRDGFVPFHKLAQWLTYSLLEPLEAAGIRIVELDALTGLPEYRNGGLFLDLGVIVPRDPKFLDQTWTLDSPAIVEWRALTVIGLDRLAAAVRDRLGLSAERFPLPRVLQGGTWSAGRRIARQLRSDAGPPLRIALDGVTF